MSLILLNSQSNQRIPLDRENPLIIGRNNVLGCFDKKVSRNHGRITCTENGKINLVALHSNPCFFMKNGVPPIRQLNKDEEETLNEGDCLGLLPNSFWFQILSNKNVKIKKEPEEASGESCRNSDTENDRETKPGCSETKDAELFTTDHSSTDYLKRIGSPEFEKTRKLPLSMYDTDDLIELDSWSSINNEIKTKKLKLDDECSSSELSVNNNGKNSEEPCTSKVCVDESLEGDIETVKKTDTPEGEGSGEKTESSKVTKKPICMYEHNCFRKNPQHKIDFCHPGDPDYVPYEKRPPCPFGARCYRRSNKHRVEFRHPPAGSPDSSLPRPPGLVGEERPPCFGGSYCVNWCPQHRKDFYHPPKGYVCEYSFEDSSSCSSEDFGGFEIYEDNLAKEYDSDFASSPLPAKRRRKKVKRSSDYEDEDEYDLEDPFINDASSDEYVPSDSDSDEDWGESQET